MGDTARNRPQGAGDEAGEAARGRVRRITTVTLAALASAALFFTVLFTCLQIVAFDESRYAAGQAKFGLPAAAGMSAEDMRSVMHELLLYCRGDRSDLNIEVMRNGVMQPAFNERERTHMVDVQRLFVRGFKARTVMIVAFFFLLLVLFYVARRRTLRELARGWIIAVSVLGALLAALGIWFAVDFEGAWTQFHLLFFSNDLWLLSYDDLLIRMLLPLFDGIVQAIILSAAAALAAITVGAALVLRFAGRHKAPKGAA